MDANVALSTEPAEFDAGGLNRRYASQKLAFGKSEMINGEPSRNSGFERMLSLRRWRAATMAKSRSAKGKRSPRFVLKLPDLERSKTDVVNSLMSACSQRTYEHAIREFIDWYCSEPRLAFNKTVVTRYRIALEQKPHAPATINLRLAAVRRLAQEAAYCGLLSAVMLRSKRQNVISGASNRCATP